MAVTVRLTSDFICPWCLIGARRLALAIEALPETIAVDVQWLPFELNPDMPKEGIDRRTYRTLKFGSWERSLELDAQTNAAGAADGIHIDYERITRTPNTFAAHRLALLGARQGRQSAVAEAILDAYFFEGRDIGDRAVLVEIAGSAGLDPEAARRFLDSDEDANNVRLLEAAAQSRGVSGVPHFDIEGMIGVGAQPVDAVAHAIRTADARTRNSATSDPAS